MSSTSGLPRRGGHAPNWPRYVSRRQPPKNDPPQPPPPPPSPGRTEEPRNQPLGQIGAPGRTSRILGDHIPHNTGQGDSDGWMQFNHSYRMDQAFPDPPSHMLYAVVAHTHTRRTYTPSTPQTTPTDRHICMAYMECLGYCLNHFSQSMLPGSEVRSAAHSPCFSCTRDLVKIGDPNSLLLRGSP